MAQHATEEFNFERVPAQAGLSQFHFNRVFKTAAGVAPSQHHINPRRDAARRLLEAKKSVMAVSLDAGCTNPSHVAQLFHLETARSPCESGRQR